MRDLYRLSHDVRLIRWLCREAGGFYVDNPIPPSEHPLDEHPQGETRRLMGRFSRFMKNIATSTEHDRGINLDSAARIRRAWEDIKEVGKQFVVACEEGFYQSHRQPRGAGLYALADFGRDVLGKPIVNYSPDRPDLWEAWDSPDGVRAAAARAALKAAMAEGLDAPHQTADGALLMNPAGEVVSL